MLIVQGYELSSRRAVPITVGLIDTAAGGVQLAMRVGEDGEPILLPIHVGAQLIVNLREALDDRFKITGERLGGDQS